MDKPAWEKFEIAVANFVKALDSSARVTHDAKLPDIHSKTIRQRDVWVEAKVCQHFPVKILISCKRKKRILNQQDIDAFNGERISSGAQLGVIYSFSGFTNNALEKGKTLGISCCMIFDNEPTNIPENIV
ncbi:MAG: restriction endonuclease, partial [bacterium]